MRPDAFKHAGELHKAANPNCHFCNNSEPAVWQTPRGHDWRVKVVANAFPALSMDNAKALGRQELVINTPDHDLEFSDLPLSHIEEVFEAYSRRLTALKQLPHVRYVLIFKNDGPKAGASVPHAHCQIYALPLIPPQVEEEADAMNHYWADHKTCAYCDVITWETGQKVRVIASDKYFIAVAPYASNYTFEAWVLPRRHINEFSQLHASELHSLAVIMKKISATLDSNNISFNYLLQESLPGQDHHFVLKVEPRTTIWAGAEMGTGIIINPVTPEYAALWYKGKA
jgi:UDPglucose--hexose-1-phosphate uridylyltransferase